MLHSIQPVCEPAAHGVFVAPLGHLRRTAQSHGTADCRKDLGARVTDRRHELVRRRKLAGYSQESLAAALEIDRRTVARWEAGTSRPHPTQRPPLATLLGLTVNDLSQVIGENDAASTARDGGAPALTLGDGVQAGLAWLDNATDARSGSAYTKLAAGIRRHDLDRNVRPFSASLPPDQAELAEFLHQYYGSSGPWQQYSARTEMGRLRSSVLTRADWLDVGLPLGPHIDGIRFQPATVQQPALDDVTYQAAIARLSSVIERGTALVNHPLYRLTDVSLGAAGLRGTVAVTSFVDYALTMDLLESELLTAVIGGQQGRMPLRDRYLPDVDAVTDIGSRLCAGGALALTAIARPRTWRHDGDYLLLVQERSARVLNGNRRLAVIPKAFHGPLTDVADDAPIGATLVREMEEELFGRDDVDSTIVGTRRADPMHRRHLSEPMAWLTDNQDSWRMECTGLGYNLVNGNYEFASLIVIEDESWWARFGGHVEANWESETLHRYSSRDRQLLDTLAHDSAWSGEGLFALLQGLRRLAVIGGHRVDIPDIELDLR